MLYKHVLYPKSLVKLGDHRLKCSIVDILYVVGGYDTYFVLAFDLSTGKTWKTSPMILTRAYTECAASKTELVVCGGCKSVCSLDNVKDVEVYNPETDKYVNLPPPGFKLTDPTYNYSTFHSF